MENLPIDEREIVAAILDVAAARGLLVSVYDGEEWAVKPTADYATAREAVGATDETTLRFRNPAGGPDAKPGPVVGTVALIHGNGCDLIHDWSDNPTMAALLAPALAVAERASV